MTSGASAFRRDSVIRTRAISTVVLPRRTATS
jgi:hypothetical protein